ncbi:HalOD1 output domain-containing protein [Saliphagus sp. GCM10025334]
MLPVDRHTFETEFSDRTPSMAIIEAIATIEGVDPLETDFTLYEYLDPVALDTLFCSSATDTEGENELAAHFEIENYSVTVEADGVLTIEASDEPE